MTTSVVVRTEETDSALAGDSLGQRLRAGAGEDAPDVVMLFASSAHRLDVLVQHLHAAARPRILVGSSSAGEFTNGESGQGSACAIALRAPEMRFAAGVGRNLSRDRHAAARSLVASFAGTGRSDYAHHSALVLTDALAGHADELVAELTLLTGGQYRFFGGGAGGDDRFDRRFVMCGTEVIGDAAVALEILSNKPLGIGVRHGWLPKDGPYRVTEAEGTRLVSLNAVPAAEVFEEYAEKINQHFDRRDPLPFFLHNVVGVDTGAGHKIRVPLAVNDDGSVTMATEVPPGATVSLMGVTTETASVAAAESARDAMAQLEGEPAAVALFFDCVATRLRMGADFGVELEAVEGALGATPFAGCNSIGQIARADGQLSGFHNCTAVVCVIPE